MNYEITRVYDRIIDGKLFCGMVVSVDSDEISSTGFSVEFELTSNEKFGTVYN